MIFGCGQAAGSAWKVRPGFKPAVNKYKSSSLFPASVFAFAIVALPFPGLAQTNNPMAEGGNPLGSFFSKPGQAISAWQPDSAN
jgi:hypothetical protein